MQVVVKKRRIRLEGEIKPELVQYLRETYGDVEVIEDEDEELVEITKSEWYRSIRNEITPGEVTEPFCLWRCCRAEFPAGRLNRFS